MEPRQDPVDGDIPPPPHPLFMPRAVHACRRREHGGTPCTVPNLPYLTPHEARPKTKRETHAEPCLSHPSRQIYYMSVGKNMVVRNFFAKRLVCIMKEVKMTKDLFSCAECGGVPSSPVTGNCGHTRCMSCVQDNAMCPCGVEIENVSVDFTVQTLVSKLTPQEIELRGIIKRIYQEKRQHGEPSRHTTYHDTSRNPSRSIYSNVSDLGVLHTTYLNMLHADQNGVVPEENSQEVELAKEMITAQREYMALPYLVMAAAFGEPQIETYAKKEIYKILPAIQISLEVWKEMWKPHPYTLFVEAAQRFLHQGQLECILCSNFFRKPVKTPCGHTFCRACLERVLDYNTACPLCSASLEFFNVAVVQDSKFLVDAIAVSDAARSLNEIPDPDEEWMPMFGCTIAYPSVPCPLLVFEPRYKLMIRRCMNGNRRFGMVATGPRGWAEYGTVLEITDCIRRRDGTSLISTIGLTRFRILERDEVDGYGVARIDYVYDIVYSSVHISSNFVRAKAERWYSYICEDIRREIELVYGPMPPLELPESTPPNGESWLWWVLAILPLPYEDRMVLLSTSNHFLRLATIGKTLDKLVPNECPQTSQILAECARPWSTRHF